MKKQISIWDPEHIETFILSNLFDGESVWKAYKHLPVNMFRQEENREIYETMLRLDLEQKPAWNIPTVYPELKSAHIKQHLVEITDGRYIDGSIELWPEHYTQKLRDYNSTKLVNDSIQEIGAEKPMELVADITARVTAQQDQVVGDNQDTLNQLYKDYEQTSKTSDGIIGLKTGWKSLDDIILGFHPGCLYVVGARPGMGKSAFAINLALQAILERKRVYVQALEETAKQILRRMTANLSGIPLDTLIRGKLADEDWGKLLNKTHEQIRNFDLVISEKTNLSSSDIVIEASKQHAKKPLDMIIVDHMQLIREKGMNSRHLEIDYAAGILKGLAKNLNVPVIILSQIKRPESRSQDPSACRPQLSDLKESGGIEENADAVMLLFRSSYYTQSPDYTLEAIVAKNRNGRCGVAYLDFNGELMRIKPGFKPQDTVQDIQIKDNKRWNQ